MTTDDRTPDPGTSALTGAPDAPAPNSSGASGQAGTPVLPPDPAAYDSERAAHARARGLPAPYIAGGRDPDPEQGLAEERRYGRLLLWMVAIIVLAGFVLGFIGLLVETALP